MSNPDINQVFKNEEQEDQQADDDFGNWTEPAYHESFEKESVSFEQKAVEINTSCKEQMAKEKPLFTENALLQGFMAGFGKKLENTLKTERAAPSETLV